MSIFLFNQAYAQPSWRVFPEHPTDRKKGLLKDQVKVPSIYAREVTAQTYSTTEQEAFIYLTGGSPVSFIQMNGTVDGVNSYTRKRIYNLSTEQYEFFAQSFQPMEKLKITNVSSLPIRNPLLKVNGKGIWKTIKQLASEVTQGATTDEQRAKILWNFIRNYRYANYPLKGTVGQRPLQLINSSGVGYCGTWAMTLESMIDSIDIPARFVELNGHTATEALYNGGYHFLDPHYEFFMLDWNSANIASTYNIFTDRRLLERTLGTPSRAYELSPGDLVEYDMEYSEINFVDNYYKFSMPIDFTLWPSESLTYYWTLKHDIRTHIYPEVTDYADPSLVAVLERPLPGAGIYEMSAPSFFVGAEIGFRVVSDTAAVKISFDGISWVQVGIYSSGTYQLSLDPWVDKDAEPELYKFYVQLEGNVDSATLTGFFQIAYQVMPVLRIGTNEITVDADSAYELEIQVQWQETSFTLPPAAIQSPIYPEHRQILRYRPDRVIWSIPVDPDGDPIVDYEVIVSDDPLCRWPVSPNLERLISISKDAGTNTFSFDNSFLNNNQTYYWKVRAQDKNGIWGPWSSVFEFTVQTLKSSAVMPWLMLLLGN